MDAITQKIPVRNLANGDQLSLKTYQFKGSGNAPNVYIQANLHGSEVQGNLVIQKLIEYFQKNPPQGTVTLVPNANPYGLNQKMGEYTFGRFDPVTGDNYNRLYWNLCSGIESFVEENWELSEQDLTNKYFKHLQSVHLDFQTHIQNYGSHYGRKLCLTLQSMANQNEIVLDLHTASTAIEHLYAPAYTSEAHSYLGIDTVIETQLEFEGALDEACFVPWIQLQTKLKELKGRDFKVPVHAYTVELGSQELASQSQAEEQLERILNYLKFQNVVSGEPTIYTPQVSRSVDQYKGIFAPSGGIFTADKFPGDFVKEGDLLGSLIVRESKKSIKSPYSGVLVNQFASSVVHEGIELYRILCD